LALAAKKVLLLIFEAEVLPLVLKEVVMVTLFFEILHPLLVLLETVLNLLSKALHLLIRLILVGFSIAELGLCLLFVMFHLFLLLLLPLLEVFHLLVAPCQVLRKSLALSLELYLVVVLPHTAEVY
jgi:hypothetical protein